MTTPVPVSFSQRLRLISPVDAAMLTLALVSVVLLSFDAWANLSDDLRQAIIIADTSICGVFAVEFLWRWRRMGWQKSFVLRNWYEILGMIPVAHPALRGLRLLRILRIVVLLARVGYAADRALGDDFTFRLVNRFRQSIVDALSGAITVAVLNEVEEVLQKGQYTRNVLRAFDSNQAQLQQMTLEKLRSDPQLKRLSRLPFYDDLVERLVAAILRVMREFLADPRTDLLVADILKENLHQIRQAVQQKDDVRQVRPAIVAPEETEALR